MVHLQPVKHNRSYRHPDLVGFRKPTKSTRISEDTKAQTRKGLCLHIPATYHIHVQGILESGYSNRLAGMKITTASQKDEAPVTTLEGALPDQPAHRLQYSYPT